MQTSYQFSLKTRLKKNVPCLEVPFIFILSNLQQFTKQTFTNEQ
jgi:hypothetical protein